MNVKAISRILKSTLVGTVFFLSLVLVPVLSKAQDAAYPTDEAVLKAGEKLFKLNCKSCHNIDSDMTGPALKGVTERHSIDWIKTWVRGPKTMIDSGDPAAVALYNKWKTSGVMTAFNLKDDEILSLIGYIETWEAPVVEVAVGDGAVPGETSSAMTDDTITLVLGVVLVVLVLIIVVLVLISTLVMKSLKAKELTSDESEFVDQKHSLLAVVTHPAFIGIVVLFTVVVGLLYGVKSGLYNIGVQQSYAPTQPIPFSHKIHAGDHEIDCNYCHTGVRKAKHANIPSPNICMNCHTQVKKDSPWIAKIYEAIDYDPATGEYGENKKPIEWVRVHNLPDLVYFNHQQHVKVGGIDCETCHGPIKEMDVVYQYSPLTMGWCIDCHRTTDVNTQGNEEYYDALLKAHEESGKEGPMKVEDIGGLECAKCHY